MCLRVCMHYGHRPHNAKLCNSLTTGYKIAYYSHHHRRSKGGSGSQLPAEPSIPPPPELPPNIKAPWINIPTSTFSQDWGKLVNSESHADVVFHLSSESYYAHRSVQVGPFHRLCILRQWSILVSQWFGSMPREKELQCSSKDCPTGVNIRWRRGGGGGGGGGRGGGKMGRAHA